MSTPAIPTIPPAIYRGPLCPICDAELVGDPDIWQCEACSLYWPTDDPDADGEAEELDGPRCGEEHLHRFYPAAIYRCVRLRGHCHPGGSPTFHAGLKFTDEPRGVAALTWHPNESRTPQTSGGAS